MAHPILRATDGSGSIAGKNVLESKMVMRNGKGRLIRDMLSAVNHLLETYQTENVTEEVDNNI